MSNLFSIRQISRYKVNIKCYTIIKGDDSMKEMYIQSLRMIKNLNVKNKKEYIKLVRDYRILNLESLKYISQTRNFRKIRKMAENA